MIRVDALVQRGDFTLELSFEADAPVTGVFGPSGCGKTTLISAIAGVVEPTRGSIINGGHVLFESKRRVNVPTHRRNLGVVFQEDRLFPHLSVESNLLYGCSESRWLPVWRKNARQMKLLSQIVDLLELGPLLARRPRNLSGGERQRVALGRALLSQPSLLMLDEPLSSLDRRLKQQIIPYLQRIRDAGMVPMLYVSHDLTELLQLTDRLLVLERGTLVGHGRYMDLMHDDRVHAVVHDRGMENVLVGRVRSHDDEHGLSVLTLKDDGERGDSHRAERLITPRIPADVGSCVTIAFSRRDVALAHGEVRDISIQNQLMGTVLRCTDHTCRAIIEVDIGRPIMVELSRPSAQSMGLQPGRSVACLIKSHAIQYIGPAN